MRRPSNSYAQTRIRRFDLGQDMSALRRKRVMCTVEMSARSAPEMPLLRQDEVHQAKIGDDNRGPLNVALGKALDDPARRQRFATDPRHHRPRGAGSVIST